MDYQSSEYFQGLIRNMESNIKLLLARMKELEKRIQKIPITNASGPTDREMFEDTRNDLFISDSLDSDTIKNLINGWIRNGELEIPLHDHTDDNKGGDAYGGKGAALL